ncbi:MAG TPA: hypothetical protein VJV78_38700 [Polyangiales bacterium]|nr:hypothetical protein [Polyangiales bacterium]
MFAASNFTWPRARAPKLPGDKVTHGKDQTRHRIVSYDLYFLRVEDSADPQSFLEELGERPAASTFEDQARKQTVVDALRRVDPALEPFPFDYEEIAKALGTTVEEARQTHSHVELNGPDDGNGVQITVYGDHVDVTIAYWHAGAEASRIFSLIERYASEIVASGEYRVYDPQLERVVDSFDEIRADALNLYAGVVEKVPSIVASSENKARPWWKFW